ncbi:MAG: tRNA threonylcarbamoyladenosine dehydratase [Oscillospiraceae bacterium]|nr:tRNA threonylcarbamoyladenosine dehydratase [Oscillospiraceae bacterium]
MDPLFSRTEILFGEAAMQKLKHSHVAVFGVGGVGGYTVEALARSGIGRITLVDPDEVGLSNINRQLPALHSTLGMKKVEAAKARILDINPAAIVDVYPIFYTPDIADSMDLSQFDYIVDAIDTVTGKLCLVQRAFDANVPIISCMGAGNKLDGTAFRVADISKTSVCPLARIMRKELKKRGISHLKVVFSTEDAMKPVGAEKEAAAIGKRQIPGSTSFIPGIAGLLLAGEVIKDLAAPYFREQPTL